MITLHTGKLGVGKSYWAVRDVWKQVVRGKDCYVNFPINFDSYYHYRTSGLRGLLWALWIRFTFGNRKFGRVYYWETLEDFYQLRNAEVYFDEAHMAIEARDFAKLPRSFKVKLTQSRKYGLNLHFISQHQGQIDIAVRRLANDIMVHKKLWKLFYWKEYDGEAIEILSNPEFMAVKPPKSLGFGIYPFSKKLAQSYNTKELFEPFENYKKEPMWSTSMYYKKQLALPVT